MFLAFILATVLGTVSHELGHYFVAQYLGYEADLHYNGSGIVQAPEICMASDGFWIAAGGPIQTLLTGSIGFLVIFINRKKYYSANELSVGQWFWIFIALFWLRQTTILSTWIGGYWLNGYFSHGGDEVKLAKDILLPDWTILVGTGLIGFGVLGWIAFKVVPLGQRFTFVLAGLFGGISGYFLWFKVVGRMLMP